MSSVDTMDQSTGTEQAEANGASSQIPQPAPPRIRNTQPSLDRIIAQVRQGEEHLGIFREGSLAVECREVEDGIAFRPFYSTNDQDWRWMRWGDAEEVMTIHGLVQPAEYLDTMNYLSKENRSLQAKLASTIACMGAKSKQRLLQKQTEQEVAK